MTRFWMAAAIITASLVLVVEGLNGFAAWNLTPVAAGVAAVLVGGSGRREWRAARYTFCAVALLLVGALHLAWHFDWGRFATGSSTAGLIFVFAPLYTMVIAFVAAVVAAGLAAIRRHRTSADPGQQLRRW